MSFPLREIELTKKEYKLLNIYAKNINFEDNLCLAARYAIYQQVMTTRNPSLVARLLKFLRIKSSARSSEIYNPKHILIDRYNPCLELFLKRYQIQNKHQNINQACREALLNELEKIKPQKVSTNHQIEINRTQFSDVFNNLEVSQASK